MEFICPGCEGIIDAGPEWAGHTTACPHCEVEIVVPGDALVEEETPRLMVPVRPQRTLAAPVRRPVGAAGGYRPQGGMPGYYMPKTTSGAAVASMVLGLLGVFPLAIVFGHVGRGEIRSSPSKQGDGYAMAGLILGYLGAVIALVLVFFWGPVVSSFGDRHQDRELERGVMLCKAIRMYSYQSEGMFPENLGRLVESRKATAEMTLYDPTGSGSAVPWIYFPGLDENSERNMIVLAAPEVVNGRRITVFVHGGGMRMLESDYQLRVAQKPKPKLKPMPAPESEPESEPLPELETDEPAMEEEAEDVEVEVEEGEATSMESR